MGRKKNLECTKLHCHEPVLLGGLCEEHHTKQEEEEQKQRTGRTALETSMIDGRIADNAELRQELWRAQQWWGRATQALRLGIDDSILKDEAEAAMNWCITIAYGIAEAERAFRKSQQPSITSSHLKELAWKRFENLEAGLMSNGVKRPDKRKT